MTLSNHKLYHEGAFINKINEAEEKMHRGLRQ